MDISELLYETIHETEMWIRFAKENKTKVNAPWFDINVRTRVELLKSDYAYVVNEMIHDLKVRKDIGDSIRKLCNDYEDWVE